MIEQTVAEKNILQRNLAKFIISDVFNLITEDDVLRINIEKQILSNGREQEKKTWLHKGKELSPEQVKVLRVEAQSFLKSNLWQILRNELLYHAQTNTLNKSTTDTDLISGKMLMYFIEVIEKRLDRMVK